ncbi:Cobalt ABC transporter, inner membrane subunit CbiQ [Candidatus Promineifilum breve]|uniref:Cobalt ABC transporter, inner membrane subunit CbiQ n=1 Tax=Candidatus Promineifilum breve TaxID=1806508 RepID=A0A160T5U9_9CHLR|nr:cobalt ECF transporter T component CbiQ [Candidatus Promineifilum breve]CUS05656.1 Cobalt ABC transporter, inner membrane subunit CbiQ [Candidatus Promineifilum breve]
MNATSFDRYLARASVVHRLDPRVKVVVALAFIAGVALLPDGAWAVYGAAVALVLAVAVAARLSPWLVVRRSLVGLPFLLAAVTVLFIPGRIVLAGPWGLDVSDAGLLRFGSIVGRSLISLSAAVLLTATTRFPDVLHALRHLRVPAVLVAIIAFMYRYLFVLVEEVERLLRARASRSARPVGGGGGGSLGWRAGVAGHMAGQLLLRSLDRSDRVYAAMQARGYRGELLTLAPHAMRAVDWLALGGGLVVVVLLQLVARI